MRRAQLVELCKQYALGTTGNMKDFKAKLEGFSENKIRWKYLIPGAKRSHRGVRDGKINKTSKVKQENVSKPTKKAKLSTLRRNEMMGQAADGSNRSQLFVAERSKDMRTLEEKQNLLTWARAHRQANPYLPPEEIAKRLKVKADADAVKNSPSIIAAYIRSTQEQIAGLTSMVGMLVERSTGILPAALPMAPISPTLQVALPSLSIIPESQSLVPFTPVAPTVTILSVSEQIIDPSGDVIMHDTPVPAASPVDSGDVTVYRIGIGNGKRLAFKYTDILDPPHVTFVTNIARLDRVWDDEAPNWDAGDCSKISIIKGATVALRYWPDIYKNKNDQRWKGVKAVWTEWKYVVERYRSSTPDAFWVEFSADGERFTWKAICAHLRGLRVARDEKLTTEAKAEYGDRFAQVFCSRGKVMVDKSSIARRYLSLKNNSMNVD